MLFDDILAQLGDFGRYQRRTYFLVCLMVIPVAWHVLAQVFIAADVDHWCAVPQWEAKNCSNWNLTQKQCDEAKRDASIPPSSISSSGKVTYAQCQQYDISGIDFYPGIETANITNDTLACDNGWVYDTSQYKSTIITEFNLVCDKGNVDNYAQSVFFAGFLCGSFVFGSLADWIGRQKTLFICLLVQTIFGTILALSPAFWFFALCRFFLASATIGVYFIGFVLATEYVGPSKRIIVGALVPGAFAVGYMFLTILAVMIRKWWVLQLVISLPILGLLPLVFILPESARWLMSRGRYKRAQRIIRKVARVNNVKMPENLFMEEMNAFEELESTNPEAAHKRTSFLDLFRTPNMRIKTLNIMFIWFVNSLVYHGLSLSTSSLGVDDYAAFFISGAIEIPSYILLVFVAEKWGRRLTLTYSMVIGGFACLISIFLPSGAPRLTFAMIGKFCVALSYALIYVFSSELFPTPVRSVGMGVSNVACYIGGILTPILLTFGDAWEPLPYFVFGLLGIIAGVLALLLPETLGKNLPDTLDEGEQFGRNRLRSFLGRFPSIRSRQGPQSRQASLWMKSPTYEKVVTQNNDSIPKNENRSLWIKKPDNDEMFSDKKEAESDEEEGAGEESKQEHGGHVLEDETIEMELSTFKEDPEPLDNNLESGKDTEHVSDDVAPATDQGDVVKEPDQVDATAKSFEKGMQIEDSSDQKVEEDCSRIDQIDVNDDEGHSKYVSDDKGVEDVAEEVGHEEDVNISQPCPTDES